MGKVQGGAFTLWVHIVLGAVALACEQLTSVKDEVEFIFGQWQKLADRYSISSGRR